VHYGLLTDFTDAANAEMPGDDELVKLASNKLEALNQKYKTGDTDIFFLFHRPRLWNKNEGKWMGYERKRGKLSALNALLRGGGKEKFSHITGDIGILTRVKYVITLDSDTQLPRESVWKLVATMAHPLNHPVYSQKKRRVIEGYGILQPRVASSIPEITPSLYLRMQGDVSGIDPYTRVSSDVYQDLFGEGSFIGKGIYDVDVFEQSLNQVFPDNRILSHDLLEGCYARSGLLSDVLLYEENPSQYSVAVKRHHRWIRGDWQIGAWMLPFITNGNGRVIWNKLSMLSRWKIFDNIRRSLLPASLLILLLLGWTILPYPWFWTACVTVIILLPVISAAGLQLVRKPDDLTVNAHISEVATFVRDNLIRFVFVISMLPHEAYKYADAIIRANWRMIVTKRKLLEWMPSANVATSSQNNIQAAYQAMWIGPLLSVASIVLLAIVNPPSLFVAVPILTLWLLAPAISWRLSKPAKDADPALSSDQLVFLHRAARKTWSYFEEFVNENENWLPPDNYQEQPIAVVAHRTSPTNMGLALLANLSAYDFGYISDSELMMRCGNTLQSMGRLERYKGHFFNWYDTESLQPLKPRYVSSVDSGNLAGHLLTLQQGLLSLPNQPVFDARIFNGIRDTMTVVRDLAQDAQADILSTIDRQLEEASGDADSLKRAINCLESLHILALQLFHSTANDIELNKWCNKLVQQLAGAIEGLKNSMPWFGLLHVTESNADLNILDAIQSLKKIYEMPDLLFELIDEKMQAAPPAYVDSLKQLKRMLEQGRKYALEKTSTIAILAEQCGQLCDVDYDFLLDKSTSLLRIGYNVEEDRKDASSYDLLASEARLGIFVAISQGKLLQESWFALGRLLTNSGGDPILLSWSGSMFEYLMPELVMPSYKNTLLYQTNKATVTRQIDYASQRGVPWGISESGYNNVDANLNYQYRAFGVPGLGLKRGLEEDLVVAPYASMLALMVMPATACSNLQLLAKEGFEGTHGFYEAIDYTATRVPRDKDYSVIKSYMVHHQGMSLLSLAYVLLDKPMQQRFVSDLGVRATLLLLQERIPRATVFYAHTADQVEMPLQYSNAEIRRVETYNTAKPEIQLLSNGQYEVMVTSSGGGYSRWRNIAISRWREDATKDAGGMFCYIMDVSSGKFWSNTYQPTLVQPKSYEAVFSQGYAEYRREDNGFETRTEIVISPEDDAEMRRIRITNRTQSVKVLEVTSYAEVVLASQASDEAHSAFSNLFVQTKIVTEYTAIVCTRRPRSAQEKAPWMFHHMDVHGAQIEETTYETDRMKFIGRSNNLTNPDAMYGAALSGSQGAVLDPIVSIRYRITLKPGQTAVLDLIYGVADTWEACEGLLHKYRDQHLKKRAFELSWTHSQVLLRQINATEADAQLYNRLAASVIYTNPASRADAAVILSNHRGQSGLWSHSISGDLPIVLVYIHDTENLNLVQQMVQAHAYWNLKGLPVDLVIWNEDYSSYRQVFQEQILALISTQPENKRAWSKPGNIFVKSADQLSAEDRILFASVARVIIHDDRGSLAEQIDSFYTEKTLPPLLQPSKAPIQANDSILTLPEDLVFFNGLGGFTQDGKEYKIVVSSDKTTPAPWVNVIANRDFGTVISENGSAYTWAINAHEYRTTPWSNDPVSNAGGEAFYLRDEETGTFWSPSPYPSRSARPYIVTHGFGYTEFEHAEQGVHSKMSVFVDKDLPVKFVVLKIRNSSGRARRISATGYLDIILGDLHSKTSMHVTSEYNAENSTLLFSNKYNAVFAGRVSFFTVQNASSYTADRSEFIGRNTDLQHPAALYRKKLSGRSGAGLEPGAALQVILELGIEDEKEIVFQIGSEENSGAALALVQKFRSPETAAASLQQVKTYWEDILGAVQITTPDVALNMLTNGWLMYQTLSSRLFARSGFYQSGGAFGFRDQLQDVMSLLHTQPQIARDQILLNASRQFAEGDVQHWWHPPEGQGVRTHCSDDLLWLPYVVSHYIKATGDTGILDQSAGFLESRLLHPGEDSLYELPVSGNLTATIYEHCTRAINRSLHFGAHGMPLMGSGDWNDGMDQVGVEGKGESVWLGFFLYDVLQRFADTADGHGDITFAETCRKEALTLLSNIEISGWDGNWYLRAFFDDGTPLGSKESTECNIDAISQSWAVLSGAANSERAALAMTSLDKYLVRRDLALIQLLEPAFDHGDQNPGYIKGYVPGVRENGGQYSHAAIWALMAFAKLEDRQKVWELFTMVNPISHASHPEAVSVYKVEPYVMAADVYANASHKGRGGWTWYTGSSGWMYQFIIGSLLGLELRVDRLTFNPCYPLTWPSVDIQYRYGKSIYNITVFQQEDISSPSWLLDDRQGSGNSLLLTDDGKSHIAEVHVNVRS
jgi:cyclic beta-1,2-glucan synthetase